MTDRRRINGPPSGTQTPIFASTLKQTPTVRLSPPTRTREPTELRKIFLKTGLVPSSSGSAYLELQHSSQLTSLKITCTAHGPRPLPRSAPFSPQLVLSTTVKFAPFASRVRRGYVRDSAERDLAVHLETALRGVVLGDRWPKSGCDVVVTVLEGEEDAWWGDVAGARERGEGWGLMCVLAGCITVASAAIMDAGIDCVDLITGGVAAVVEEGGGKRGEVMVLDPCPAEHRNVLAACVVGYLASRDEITEVWMKGNASAAISAEELIEKAVGAAAATKAVLEEAIKEAAFVKFPELAKSRGGLNDIDMNG
ncbi:hypothetical protein M501DRAFT_975994 [Patellaria atrata CBS 101060]|uniref:Exoribonuclease phosphorolytic domain-containing protein n=1 Tax=Patellaria atrata CBS 101060 TaxID=1346257 RepID=A0A9P4VSW0_9PEZI|nr:hypothetical protein M501DRAFT_975994 [Patellaria atrata CBS 101060]